MYSLFQIFVLQYCIVYTKLNLENIILVSDKILIKNKFILIIVQRDATQQSIYYSTSSLYMFRVSTTPIIRSTQNCNYSLRYWSYFCAATSLQCGQGCSWHQKHVEWTCRILNRLICVASRWTIINVDFFISLRDASSITYQRATVFTWAHHC